MQRVFCKSILSVQSRPHLCPNQMSFQLIDSILVRASQAVAALLYYIPISTDKGTSHEEWDLAPRLE